MKPNGFTLIELLVVALIMTTLTAVALPQYRRAVDRAKTAEATQVLPAIYEARERWILERYPLDGCKWESGQAGLSAACNGQISFKRLDTELPGAPDGTSKKEWKTDNFKYYLIADNKPKNHAVNQHCVAAVPLWGGNHGLAKTAANAGVMIYYRGDKFSCTDASSGEACSRINMDYNADGCI